MSSKKPIEFMPRNPHPLSSLTRIFGGFCDPADAVDHNEDEQETEEPGPLARGIKSKAIAPEPAQEERAPPQPVAPKKAAPVSTSRELSIDTAIPHVPEERKQEKESVVLKANAPEKVVKPASILKTHAMSSKAKKKNVVAVESGKSERVVRILETAILTVVIVVATILVLRSLGHNTDLSFGKGGGKFSSPIRFDYRTEDAGQPVVMDIETKAAEVLEPEKINEAVNEVEAQEDPATAEREGEEIVGGVEEAAEKENYSIPDESQEEINEEEEPISETIEDMIEHATGESVTNTE
jgi:hypothetical protein